MKNRITERTISDRQTINFLIKHFNLKRLRAWKKQSWDESNRNNEIIDNLKEIREELEILEILKRYIELEYDKSNETYWLKVGMYGRTLIDEEKYNTLKEELKNG